MINAPQPTPELIKEYGDYLLNQGKSINTFKGYTTILRTIPADVKNYLKNQNLKSRKLRIVAYRSYLEFLAEQKQLISMNDLMVLLKRYKPPKQRGNGNNINLFSVPKSKWTQYIKHAPNQVAKMGIWIGFQFGLRLGEITHLRVLDIDFRSKNIRVREQRETKNQVYWRPKYNKFRSVPFTTEQSKTFKRWINEIRPKDLDHDYLLWNEKGKRKNLRVKGRCFQRWCAEAGKELDSRKFKPHIMRYSFATHYYNESKDVKLVGDLLGHSNVSTTSDYLRLGQKNVEEKARNLFNQS